MKTNPLVRLKIRFGYFLADKKADTQNFFRLLPDNSLIWWPLIILSKFSLDKWYGVKMLGWKVCTHPQLTSYETLWCFEKPNGLRIFRKDYRPPC